MNGYERTVAALELREPDQIPIFEWAIDPKVVEGLCPGRDYFGMVEELDLDGVTVRGGHLPTRDVSSASVIVDRWGVRQGRTAEAYYPIEGPIKSEADLERYTPPNPFDDVLVADLRAAVDRFKGKKFITYTSTSDFMAATNLRGFSELLVDLVDNPRLVSGILEMASEYYCALVRRVIEVGADGVMLGDDWAHNTGPFMSPAQFREFFLPYFKRAVETVKEAGGYVIKHSDGNIWSILDMVVDTGIDAINPIQPDAGMDIGEVKQKYGDRVCIAGNINCGYTLSNASEEQVVREVKEAIRKAGPGGGYIMMSSNTLHSSVKPENYRAMLETTRAYGKYPL